MRTTITLLILLFTLSLSAQKYRNFNVFKKAEIESNNQRVALVMANAAYENGPLDRPVIEAEQLVDALTTQGYDVEVGYNLDLDAMEQTIINFSRKFKLYKSGVVYFAGHGFQIDGENFLVPTDAPQTDNSLELKRKLINIDFVFEAINDPKKPKLVVLDACRNNPFKQNLPSAYRSGDIAGFAKIKARNNSEILFSTAPGTKVSDENPFTRIFSEEIMAGGCFDDVARRTNRRIQEQDPNQMMMLEGFLLEELCFGNKPVKEEPTPKVEPSPKVEPVVDEPEPVKKDAEALETALSWMQGKLPGILFSKYYDMGMLSRNYTRSNKYSMEYDAASCKITITEKDAYVEDRNSIKNDREWIYLYEIDLSDVGSIEFEESWDANYFVIKAYNGQEVIKKTSENWNETTLVKEVKIKHDELGELEGEPQRFIKAFEDAMSMCGAKKEKY